MKYDTEKLNNLDILTVALDLGIKLNRSKMALCVAHEEKNPSMGIDVKRNKWKCFACGKQGNVISLVMAKLGCSFIEACQWLYQQYHISTDGFSRYRYSNIIPRKPTSESTTQKFPPKQETHKKPDWELMKWIIEKGGLSTEARQFLFKERHIDPDVVESLNIVSISKPSDFGRLLLSKFGKNRCLNSGIFKISDKNGYPYCIWWKPCLLIPYYDVEGQIVNMQVRYFVSGKKGRYFFTPGLKIRHYNYPILKNLSENDTVYIAEGITDCLALLSDGKNAIAIPSASNIVEEDLPLLENFTLLMYPDQDSAGNSLYDKLSERIDTPIHRQRLPEGIKDYCEYHVYKANARAND